MSGWRRLGTFSSKDSEYIFHRNDRHLFSGFIGGASNGGKEDGVSQGKQFGRYLRFFFENIQTCSSNRTRLRGFDRALSSAPGPREALIRKALLFIKPNSFDSIRWSVSGMRGTGSVTKSHAGKRSGREMNLARICSSDCRTIVRRSV